MSNSMKVVHTNEGTTFEVDRLPGGTIVLEVGAEGQAIPDVVLFFRDAEALTAAAAALLKGLADLLPVAEEEK